MSQKCLNKMHVIFLSPKTGYNLFLSLTWIILSIFVDEENSKNGYKQTEITAFISQQSSK